MYKDHMTLIQDLKDYASPKARITRMIKSGEIIQVRRNVFLESDDCNYSLKSLASVIYGPSYISFEYALAYYGLIPERVNALTSAIFNKNKNRSFHTPVGDFYYYYLPPEVYPYGVVREIENNQSYLVASPEKAILDMLYKARGITCLKDLEILMFEDWRLDYQKIRGMDREFIRSIAPLYKRRAETFFLEWCQKEVWVEQRYTGYD